MSAILLHGLVPKNTSKCAQGPFHQLIACGRVTAIVSPLNNCDAFDDLTADAAAAWAMQHHEILQLYCGAGPVLPMALGAAFSGEVALLDGLQDQLPDHLTALAQLRDLREFTVKLQHAAGVQTSIHAAETGKGFLQHRRACRDNRAQINKAQSHFASHIVEALKQHADQIKGPPTHKPERIVDCSLLVPTGQIASLRALAQGHHERAASLGLELVIAGPWPPYSFADALYKEKQSA